MFAIVALHVGVAVYFGYCLVAEHDSTHVGGTRLSPIRMLAAACAIVRWLCRRPAAGAARRSSRLAGAALQGARDLEGADKCQTCHEPGRRSRARLCLSCHKPVAERIRPKKGVHRDVTDDCARATSSTPASTPTSDRSIPKSFDHAAETGFPLDGRHAPLAKDCAKCHKTRSFLDGRPRLRDAATRTSTSGSLGCRLPRLPLDDRRVQGRPTPFDHSKAAFQLTGAAPHGRVREVPRQPVFKGVKFA